MSESTRIMDEIDKQGDQGVIWEPSEYRCYMTRTYLQGIALARDKKLSTHLIKWPKVGKLRFGLAYRMVDNEPPVNRPMTYHFNLVPWLPEGQYKITYLGKSTWQIKVKKQDA